MSKLYLGVCKALDKLVPQSLQPLWNHAAGPKTIFFWAPLVKWSLVIAGLGDINRPVESVSLRQSGSLAATGIIWSRYSVVIKPKNWSLFSVNILVFLTAGYQVFRALRYQMNSPPATQESKKK